MGIAVEAVVHVGDEMNAEVQFAAAKCRRAIPDQGDVVRGARAHCRAEEAAVVAVPGDAESGGRCENDSRAGGLQTGVRQEERGRENDNGCERQSHWEALRKWTGWLLHGMAFLFWIRG